LTGLTHLSAGGRISRAVCVLPTPPRPLSAARLCPAEQNERAQIRFGARHSRSVRAVARRYSIFTYRSKCLSESRYQCADVLITLHGWHYGIQVTVYHADEGMNSGQKGSNLRRQEAPHEVIRFMPYAKLNALAKRSICESLWSLFSKDLVVPKCGVAAFRERLDWIEFDGRSFHFSRYWNRAAPPEPKNSL
jgi:hypothetical protein